MASRPGAVSPLRTQRRHVDGIELDDERADLIEDDQLPGVIRRNILWGSGPS
jgi:hypothetical protein